MNWVFLLLLPSKMFDDSLKAADVHLSLSTSSASCQASPPLDLGPTNALPFFPTWRKCSSAPCLPSCEPAFVCSNTPDPLISCDSSFSAASPTIPFLISPSHAQVSPPICCGVCGSLYTLPCPYCPTALCSSRCAFTHFAQNCCLGSLPRNINQSDLDILLNKAREALAIFPDT